MAGDSRAGSGFGPWLRRLWRGRGAEPSRDPGPRMATVLVLQPVGQPAAEYTRLRRALMAGGGRSHEDDPRIVAAAFDHADDAVEMALRLLAERGNALRAALSVGALGSVDGPLAGAALADARSALRYAGPGGLVLGARFSPSLLDGMRPDLAHLLQPVSSGRTGAAPMAYRVDGAELATLSANPRASAATRREARAMRHAVAITTGVMLLAAVVWLVGRARERPALPASAVPAVALAIAHDS